MSSGVRVWDRAGMPLSLLTAGVGACGQAGDVRVTGVTEDSRHVARGDLFVARGGTREDGSRFVADAVHAGAAAVVSERPIPGCVVPQVIVSHAGRAASILAHRLAGEPTRDVKVFAVTGTNGKTTVAYLTRHLLTRIGVKCGMVGTVEIDDGRTASPADMTTPPAVALAGLLARMRSHGCGACAIEASSHALHQGRLAGVRFAAAGFTNLTGDHLDYHRTMHDYADAKATLFRDLPDDAPGVINAEDPHAGIMLDACRGRAVTFSVGGRETTGKSADWRTIDLDVTSQGTRFTLVSPRGRATVRTPLVGTHNVQNALVACATVGEALGTDVRTLADVLSDATGAPGRLQRVGLGQPFGVFVDYAHTDDALSNVLRALRPLTAGRLRVVFGCGGDRDATKRPRMGVVAGALADDVYLTSDNPRTEDPRDILRQIAVRCPVPPRRIDPDRRSTIVGAVADCGPGDTLIIAGKGHEHYQILGTTKHPFDDVEVATAALRGAGYGRRDKDAGQDLTRAGAA